jgi:hypothetical protein
MVGGSYIANVIDQRDTNTIGCCQTIMSLSTPYGFEMNLRNL